VNPASRRRAVRQLLASSLHGRRRLLGGLMAWSVVQALPTFLSGRLVAQATDRGFLAGRPAVGFAWLGLLGASVLVGAVGTRESFRRLAGLVEPFRDELVTSTVSGALRRSTAAGAHPDTAGVARLTHHVEIVREAYASVLMVVQGFLVGAVSAIVGLSTLVPAALGLVLGPLTVSLVLFVVVMVRTAPRQRATILANERISVTATSMAHGLRDVAACGGEETMAGLVGRHIDEQALATEQLAWLTAARSLTVAIGGLLPLILVLVQGPSLLRNGASTGAVLGCATYVLHGVHPALQMLVRQVGSTGLWLFVAANRIVEANAANQEPAARRSAVPLHHHIELHRVTFGYGSRAEPVLRELDLVIPEGDHLVVVGPSGTGKSTLAGLVTGMLEAESGEVRIGGELLGDLNAQALSRERVLIPQEAYVFAGTLRGNLTYLNLDATQRQLDDAVDELGMRPLVERIGGFDAPVPARSLSAGERQHITLVRAYLSPAPIVVLDEATCHLDAAAEAVIEEAFARSGRTLVVIAHRISSALRGRRVMVLDGSDVVVGTHEELQARSCLYRDLTGHWAGEAAASAGSELAIPRR